MGAVFEGLHDVGQVLSEHIRAELGFLDVQPGPPRDVTATTEPGVRLTLMYVTPQPAHRNDVAERQPDGTLRPAPLSLSCFYLVTASGADADDPIAAHHALGQIMTLYHDQPILKLPLSAGTGSPPGVFTDLGEGFMDVIQVPMTLEQIDKIWMALDVQLQPWALFEVAPVQLISRLPDGAPAPMVRPGGLRLGEAVGLRPDLVRLTPQPVRQGGRVRLDVVASAALGKVWAGPVAVPAGDPALVIGPDGAALLNLNTGALPALVPGRYPLTVATGALASRPQTLRIVEASAPAVDSPVLRHDPGTDLQLTGANLAGVEEVLLWPDAGLSAPSEVRSVPFTAVSGTAVTVRSAGGLVTLPADTSTWRLTVRIGAGVFTPYVVLELDS